MLLSKMSVEAFSQEIASSSPAPGGGSAAAQSGAMGAALVSMVAALTLAKDEGRKNELSAMIQKAEGARNELCRLIDLDTEAFLKVSAAYAMPKANDEEKAIRSKAIQEALEGCTLTPIAVIEQCAAVCSVASSLALNFNANAASDLGSAAACLQAGLKSAWLNVLINVASLKDKEKAEGYKAKAKELYERSLEQTKKVFEDIEASL